MRFQFIALPVSLHTYKPVEHNPMVEISMLFLYNYNMNNWKLFAVEERNIFRFENKKWTIISSIADGIHVPTFFYSLGWNNNLGFASFLK